MFLFVLAVPVMLLGGIMVLVALLIARLSAPTRQTISAYSQPPYVRPMNVPVHPSFLEGHQAQRWPELASDWPSTVGLRSRQPSQVYEEPLVEYPEQP